MTGFFNFVRQQGVVGLAVGFILGGSIQKVVSSLVNDIINPILGIFLGRADSLESAYFQIGSSKILWGSFLSVLIDFLIIALTVYICFRIMGLEKLDLKKDSKDKK